MANCLMIVRPLCDQPGILRDFDITELDTPEGGPAQERIRLTMARVGLHMLLRTKEQVGDRQRPVKQCEMYGTLVKNIGRRLDARARVSTFWDTRVTVTP